MSHKASKAEKIVRERKIQQMILDGNSRNEIIRFGQEHWQLSPRTIDWYIKGCKKNVRDKLSEFQIDSLARHYALRSEILTWCFEQHKISSALRVAKDQAKLLGLYLPQRVQQMKTDFHGLSKQQCEQLLRGETITVAIHFDLVDGKLIFGV